MDLFILQNDAFPSLPHPIQDPPKYLVEIIWCI